MKRVLLVDYESADRESGAASLTELGCIVTSFSGNFESRMSAYGHKEAGKPFDVALVNLFAFRDPASGPAYGEERGDRPVPTGFELALRLNDYGIERVAVVGAERVTDREFHSVLELQNSHPVRRNGGVILCLYGKSLVPYNSGVKDWGRIYQMLMDSDPKPAAATD